MTDAQVVDEEDLVEVIDGEERARVVRQQLRLDDDTPLAIERTTAITGPSRPPVVLIHGFAQNRYSWRVSGRSFSAFLASRGYEVLNLELRGHGRSRAYGAGNAESFPQYVADARRVVARCSAAPFVIGHSLGGAVALGVATEARLRGVVHLAGIWRFASRNRALRALGRATLAFEPVLKAVPVRLSTGWAGELIARLYAVTDVAGYGAPIAGWVPDSIERELLEERLALGFDWTSVEVWLQMARWAAGEPFGYAEAFAALDRPLLVIAGDADPLVRVDEARECFARSVATDKELVVFDAFDHEVHWGHVDLILGRHARRIVWPRIEDWLAARS
ncbi:MAG: alpha/beta fold hydrolase [Myxococcota bacterium]